MTVALSDPAVGSLATNAITLLKVATGIDGNITTEQPIYYVPAGLSCIPVYFIVKNASTSLTTVSFGFGFNSGTSNDVIASATHTELTGSTLYTVLTAKVGAKIGVGTSQDVLRFKASIAQGGAATFDILMFGILF